METITFLLVSYTIAYLCTELETTNNNLLLLKTCISRIFSFSCKLIEYSLLIFSK